MVRGRYRVGVSKTKTKEKIMMKKKVMPLSCLMAAAMLAGCGTAGHRRNPGADVPGCDEK